MSPARTDTLRLGTPEDFARARAFFLAAGFDDASIWNTVRTTRGDGGVRVEADAEGLAAMSPRLRWCVEIFLRGAPVAEVVCQAHCDSATLASFVALGLLRRAASDPDALVCPVWVYPVDGFVSVSDRFTDPDGGDDAPADDMVFPAAYHGTQKFLKLMPAAPGGDALDVCGGCGVGAMRLARTARVAVTADVTERATLFAEFSARLNDVAIESVCGDLYAPVDGREFDVITAHPPFVPATKNTLVFRDGGETGEDIVRRTIEGIPTHLRVGGTAMIVCSGRDTMEQTFEQRARDWLGPAGGEFDIVLGLDRTISIEQVAGSGRTRWQPMAAEDIEKLIARLREVGTKQYVHGALAFRRRAEPVAEPPLRLRLADDATAADFDRLFAWRARRRDPDFAAWLLQARPRLAAMLELRTRHVVQDGEFAAAEGEFRIERGFKTAFQPDNWIVPAVSRFDGIRSVAEVFAAAHEKGEMPVEFPIAEFVRLINLMVERGFLDLPFEPPVPSSGAR